MNKKQAIARIEKVLQEVGSVQFKIHVLSVDLFKSIKHQDLDYNIINTLYSKMGRGINKRAYKDWLLGMTILKWDRDEEKFVKPKRAKWTNLNTVLLDSTPFYTYVNEGKTPAKFDLDKKLDSLDTRIKKLIEEAIEANNGLVSDKISKLQAIELSFSVFKAE